ncbi:MAG: 4Fe-4S binding protein [Rubrivivax sp.]
MSDHTFHPSDTCVGALMGAIDAHALRRSQWLPDIDTQRCTGCGRCVAVCDPPVG